ncbi:MAG TPA: hypothetical protein GX712_05485 [Bacteroidales bacterium]|nr:hypothetical protein [Bacteroidales bacterium]
MLKKNYITISLLITFLISITVTELHAWDVILKGNQSTFITNKTCNRLQGENNDSEANSNSQKQLITKFCTFAEPQFLTPYRTILTPSTLHFTCYTPQREEVCLSDVGRPPKV